MQVAWAGELEGWVSMPVRWHLVADEGSAQFWEPLIAQWSDPPEGTTEASQPIARHPALDRKGLARFSAARAVRQEPAADLLPADFATRYRQQYVDRLWMRGLGAVVSLYLAGVAIYMIALQVVNIQGSRLSTEVAGIANTYTNVLRLKEQVQVLQEQLNLKYAALDSWKIVSEQLPADFTLNNLTFSRGRTVQLSGTAPQGEAQKVLDYNEAIRNATVEGRRLFKDVTPPTFPSRIGAQVVHWSFDCVLNVSDLPE
jgi:hypothetical protein